MKKRGSLEKLRKVRQYCNQIFRYAIATGRATINPAAELTGTLTAPKTEHFPHLQASELPAFLASLANYHGSCITRMATSLLLLTGVRTIELRAAEWQEFDLENALWTIPESRMKKAPQTSGAFVRPGSVDPAGTPHLYRSVSTRVSRALQHQQTDE
ncbi:Integrase [Citrobacter freundii]|uniref:Integrase n=1 Tax=Citrobacter freundii TaxID=546 RepID=A0A7G2IUL1_CITFR|nr:Integrase [Citrobacter freundii]